MILDLYIQAIESCAPVLTILGIPIPSRLQWRAFHPLILFLTASFCIFEIQTSMRVIATVKVREGLHTQRIPHHWNILQAPSWNFNCASVDILISPSGYGAPQEETSSASFTFACSEGSLAIGPIDHFHPSSLQVWTQARTARRRMVRDGRRFSSLASVLA
ncbi:hypothetical protein AcV5_005172 [Taiwanofungus camphoratus]|nr:hypothetical protein AcV5_005172 [Antrodia cinnamomea]